MTDLRPLDFEIFDGGMADIDTPNDRRTGEIVENFDITSVGKLIQRPGSELLDDTASLIDATTGVRTNGQTGSIVNYEDDLHLIVRSKDLLYAKNVDSFDDTTAWTKIQGPNAGWNSLPSFKALTAAGLVSSSVAWQGHEIFVGKDESLASTAYISPQKVYLDNTNTFKVINAGLPKPADPTGLSVYSGTLYQSIYAANRLKSQLNIHFADTQAHASATTAIGAADATDEISLVTLVKEIVSRFNAHADLEAEAKTAVTTESPHGVNRITHFGFDETKVTAALNYLVPTSTPTNAIECSRLINQVYWAANLHLMAFICDSDSGSYFVKNTLAGLTGATDIVNFAEGIEYRTGDTIRFLAGSLPAGISASTTYYVYKPSGLAVGSFYICTTLANARSGTYIDISADGTSKVWKDMTNLHPRSTQNGIFAGPFGSGYIYPEGFQISAQDNVVAPFGSYPHISAALQYETSEFIEGMYEHLANIGPSGAAQHATSLAQSMFFNDTNAFYYGSSGGSTGIAAYASSTYYDWQVFGGIIKTYEALRQHRLETSGGLHGVGSGETAGSLLSQSKIGHTLRYAPNPFDSATWGIVSPMLTDGKAKLILHEAQGAARHGGGAASLAFTYNGTHVFAQRRYAIVYSRQYKTYKNLKFYDRSAPNYSDSYAIAHVQDASKGFDPYSFNIQVSGVVGQGLACPSIENLDSSSIYLELYRTTDGGTEFFLVDSYLPTSGVITAYDKISDADIADKEALYTTGGVVGYDPAPQSKSVARVGDFLAFGDIVEESAPRLLNMTVPANPGTFTELPYVGHGLVNGDAVTFWGLTNLGLTLPLGKAYFVVNSTADTFSIALTPGGAVLTLSETVGTLFTLGVQQLTKLSYRVRQSFPGIGFSSPESFFVDLESDVVTVGRAQENFVAVCKQGVYRLEGRFDEQGQGGMISKKISDRVGGVSATCGITVNDLFYFMGQDGFYVTDGFKVNPLTVHLENRHQALVSADISTYSPQMNSVQCTYDRGRNRIMWTVSPTPANSPDALWVMHLNQTTTERAAITEYLNGVDFAPTAVSYFRGQLIRGDRQGFVFKHDESLTYDAAIDRSAQTIEAFGREIVPTYRSLPEDFGDRGTRKWVSKALFQFSNNGRLSVSIKSINDKAVDAGVAMKGILFRDTNYSGIIKEKRTFPAGVAGNTFQGLRCHTKQVEISKTEVILYRSDDYAKCTVSSGSVKLASGFWPTPEGTILDQYIYFETDNYSLGHLITAVSGAFLTAPTAPDMTSKKWIVKGIPRDEKMELLCFTIYSDSQDSQPNPPSGDSGANA